jgi:hypothetical protein
MGLITSFTRPSPGGAQPAFVESYNPCATAGAAGTLTANQALLVLVRVARPMTVSTITVYVGTASGNIDAGLYESDGTTWTRLASAGSTAASGTNALQTLTLGSPVTLIPGKDYWLAFAADNGTVTVTRISGTSGPNGRGNRAIFKASSFPLPATITALSAASSVPWMQAA